MAIANTPEIALGPSGTQPWFQVLCLLSVVSVGGLVVLGGVVRVTGSGLGCPDWPLCHGGFLPPLQLQPIIEYSHRLVASALAGPLVLATCISAWVVHRRDQWLAVPASVALFLLVGQALLGGVAVVQELPGGIVAAHLAVAQALLATLIILLVVSLRGPLRGPLAATRTPDMDERSKRFPPMILAAAAIVYALMLTGSYVTAAGATAVCGGWPMCQGDAFPNSGLQMIHMGHRYATLIFGLFMLYALQLGIRLGPGSSIRWLATIASALFLAQIAAGAVTVKLGFLPELRALHLSLATALWGTMVALTALAHARQKSAQLETANG